MAKQKKGPLTAPAKFIVSGASPGKFVPHVAIREPSAPPAREVVEITSVLTATVIEPNEVSFSLDGTLRIGTAFKPLADADKGLIVGFDRQSVIDDVPTVYLIRSASPTEPGVVLIQERGPFTETTGVHLNKAVVAQLQLAAHCKPTDQYARYRRLCPATIEVIGGRRYIVVDATAGRDAALKTALRGAKRLAAAAAEEE